MEQLLTRAGNMSDLAFLRMLQLIHTQTSLLAEDLKGYDVPSAIPRSPVQSMGFSPPITVTPSAATSGAGSTAISSVLETAMEELFVPYTEGQRYLERESKTLVDLYSGYLSVFTRYHVCFRIFPSNIIDSLDPGTGREID
jgi:exocyst complex component 5